MPTELDGIGREMINDRVLTNGLSMNVKVRDHLILPL